MKKLNLAIIGQGRSGRNIHGKYYLSSDNSYYRVSYVVEADAARRAQALERYEGCRVLADYRELLEIDEIDLVVNATYSEMHYPITRDLLLHGKNVLVEKPFARTYYECCDLIETAKANNVTLVVFQQSFLAPYYVAIKILWSSIGFHATLSMHPTLVTLAALPGKAQGDF